MSSGKWRPFCLGLNVLSGIFVCYWPSISLADFGPLARFVYWSIWYGSMKWDCTIPLLTIVVLKSILGKITHRFTFSIISQYWDDDGNWNPFSFNTIIRLSCKINAMVTDDRATQWFIKSATIALAYFSNFSIRRLYSLWGFLQLPVLYFNCKSRW